MPDNRPAGGAVSGRRVLLVDHDVDALAELATHLREKGLRVSLANGSQMACERAKTGAYDVVLATREVAAPTDGAMGVMDALSVELQDVPPLVLLEERTDLDAIVLRIDQLVSSQDRPRTTSIVPSSHALEHAPLGDLLLVLATELRSGTLSVTTSKGSGEVRLVAGDVADAVYVRLEGKKALTRMLSERDGTATFTPGSPAIMRRIHESSRALVTEARVLAEKAKTLRDGATQLASASLVAVEGPSSGRGDELAQHVLSRLRVPATLDDLLDELAPSDAAILQTVLELHESGRVKVVPHAGRVQLCGADQLHVVRASAARAKPAGYAGPARLVFAAKPSRIAVFAHTVLSLADAFPPNEPMPSVPVPYVLSTIRLGDGVDLDIVALPLVPAYAPLWPLSLSGAAVVVRLDDAAAEQLGDVCTSIGVPVLDARDVFGEVDESSAVQIASLVRTALEAEGASAR